MPVPFVIAALPHARRSWPLAWAGGLLLLLAAVLLRSWKLENVPGVNGDEAWSGVQAWNWSHGKEFSWRTPTGNLLNIFFLGPLALLHCALPPSFVVLRLVAVASGLAALGVGWWLARRTFDGRTAAIFAVLLGVLPIAIAYSRFAWDTAQTPLASVLVLFAGVSLIDCARPRRRAALAALAIAAAYIVHPTNILLAPLVLVPAGMRWRADHSPRAADRASPVLPVGALLLALAGTAFLLLHPLGNAAIGRIREGMERTFDLRMHLAFALNFARLFSGETVYRYLSGAIADRPGTLPDWRSVGPMDALTWLVLGVALVGAWRLGRGTSGKIDRGLFCGWLLLVAGFYLVAGPQAINPHFERYGMCLVVPTVLVISRGAAWWLSQADWRGAWAAGLCGSVALALPAGFLIQYFGFIERTGGEAHIAFRTGPVEPKLAAWRTIARQASGPVAIEADSWWTYWPLAYLAANAPLAEVRLGGGATPSAFATSAQWQVRCAAGVDRPPAFAGNAPRAGQWQRICDFSGRAALWLRHSPAETRQKN